jgi:dephospho-CoA kinase
VEAAILVETGSYKKFDRLIVAVCSLEQQMERAMKRDGMTREEVTARLSRQLPLEEKVRVANYVVDTSGTKENTMEQTRVVHNSLRGLLA